MMYCIYCGKKTMRNPCDECKKAMNEDDKKYWNERKKPLNAYADDML